MATLDLQSFIEDRLRSIDPTLDITPGSPAQTQFIQPLLTRLGTDPFETDIQTFLLDRFAQEFPDIFAGDPGVISDIFIKPLVLFLEPFKREIQTIKSNQSLIDPTLLSDDDADSLAANFFETRTTGGIASGSVRVFYVNPTNQQFEITTRFFTTDGLNFFPTNPLFITAEEMVFNRSGALFYIDIPVKAEKAGDEYNIDPDSIVGVEGIFGPVKVSNLRAFSNGSPAIDTETFVATAEQSLTERSLNTPRGASARLLDVFQSQVSGVLSIGANDVEMQRDLLVASSSGHAWLTGRVNLYNRIAYVQCRTVDGKESDAPVAGDQLYFYLSKSAFPGVLQENRLVKFNVVSVLFGPLTETAPYQISFVVQVAGDLPVGISLPSALVAEGGFLKTGTISVSSLPDVGAQNPNLEVPSGEAHIFGHTDIYVRPVTRPISKAVLNSIDDASSAIYRVSLTTTASSNQVTDPGFNFVNAGIQAGDLLSIELGNDAGVYPIGDVSSATLSLFSDLTTTTTNIRYRVIKQINVDPFEPKVFKFPFGSITSANDLITTIGSSTFVLSTNNVLNYGARVGDTIRLLTKDDAGDFIIKGFTSTSGGQGIIVNRPAGATNAQISYQIFTALDPVVRPLVRLRELMLLDSAKQSTGITVPPASPVAVVPTCSFASAQIRGGSQRKSGFILPDMTGYVTNGNVSAPTPGIFTSNRRYSLGFDVPNGIFKSFLFTSGNYAEFDLRSDTSGACSWFVATTEQSIDATNFPPIDPKPNECLTIKSGPNAGSYLIKNVIKFQYDDPSSNKSSIYFIQIYGSFKIDIMRQVLDFLDAAFIAGAAGAHVEKIDQASSISFPSFFTSSYNGLGANINAALTFYGATAPGASACQQVLDSLVKVDYEWGNPARGVLRTYFQNPTLFEERTGLNSAVTSFTFTNTTGSEIEFIPDPTLYLKQEIVPARLDSDADPLEYPRDLQNDLGITTAANFSDSSNPSMFKTGVKVGDILSVHPEIHIVSDSGNAIIQTVAGSAQINFLPNGPSPFDATSVGDLFFIEQGLDKKGYRITQFIDSKTAVLDKALSFTTPSIILDGGAVQYGKNGSDNQIHASSGTPFNSGHINKFITIYGVNSIYQGSYKILSIASSSTVNVQPTPDFPAYPVEASAGFWAITDAPTSNPKLLNVGTSTELVAGMPVREYENIVHDYTITSVVNNDLTQSRLLTGSVISVGTAQPYRVYRPNIRRITPTEMSEHKDGAFFFVDTEVVSLSPSQNANIEEGSYLKINDGTYFSAGYKHTVNDNTLTYSTKETGTISISPLILPINNTDSLINYLDLSGSPIQITYDEADAVQLVQDFIDNSLDRITSANMLARHFLPAYVSYDATYTAGSAPGVVAKAIIGYINGLGLESTIDVSQLEKIIDDNGGNPQTPTTVFVLVHDWDRKGWLELNQNQVGLDPSPVPYAGTPRVTFFISGDDVSGVSPQPLGEHINLVRL